ncbi:hypothetical protein KEJ49_06470 [Candidatus Bathyarchaeota archaeon]|nr:hypothetical protein [Candidatus Bathyarchaeota archaeon]
MTLLAWCGEPLDKHLLGTMKTYKKIESRASEVFLNRLSQYTRISNIFRDYVKFATRLAIGMHDIGKAHPNYLLWNRHRLHLECDKPRKYNCESYCKPHIPKFIMHEVLSGCIVMRYLNRLPLISEIGESQSAISLELMMSLAVAYHHEAIRTPLNYKVEEQLSSFGSWNPLEYEEAGIIVRRITEEALDGISFGPTLDEILDEFSGARIMFSETLKAWRAPGKPIVKLYALVCGPLMICDNLVAFRNRGGRAPTSFVEEALRGLPELGVER